jgi:hypothetical protein
MREGAGCVPILELSGLSGLVRVYLRLVGQCESATVKALGWFVRAVRGLFNCLTYTRARVCCYVGLKETALKCSWEFIFNRTPRTKKISY